MQNFGSAHCKRLHGAFTLLELLAVIAVIAILAALLFPVLTSATEKGNNARCISNLRQWGAGLALFLSEHGGMFPSRGTTNGTLNTTLANAWFNAIPPCLGIEPLSNLVAISQAPGPKPPFNHNIYTCPSLKASEVGGVGGGTTPVFAYAYNKSIDDPNRVSSTSSFGQILRISQIRTNAKFVVFGETSRTDSDIMGATNLVFRHGGRKFANLCFADGHVAGVETSSLTNFSWDP